MSRNLGESGGRSQQELPSGRFRSPSHNRDPGARFRSLSCSQASAHHSSNRPLLTNADNQTYIYTISTTSTTESHNTHSNRANDNRSRSPQRRDQPVPQPTPRLTSRLTPKYAAEELSPFDPHSNAFQEAYGIMMTSINDGNFSTVANWPQHLLISSSAEPVHHHSHRGKQYHSRSPLSRCRPVSHPAPRLTPQSIPRPALRFTSRSTSQQLTPGPTPQATPRSTSHPQPQSTQPTFPNLYPSDPSPFEPSSPVFRQAYQTMISSIADETNLTNIPSTSDENFLCDLEDMVREYLPEDDLGNTPRAQRSSSR